MSKLFLHTLCSNNGNYEHIARMTERFDLLNGIVAMVHLDSEDIGDQTFNLLNERKGEGKILSGPFLKDFSLSRNICLRQEVIPEGSWILILDCQEYVNPNFITNLKDELIPLFEKNNIGAIYQYSKCVVFRYWRDVTYFNSIHTGLKGICGQVIDLAQQEPFNERKNWIWSERDNELSWVKGSTYYLFPGPEHINLVYEANRFPNHPRANVLWEDHAQVRLAFFDYCREELGFEANKESLIKYLTDLKDWPAKLVEFFAFEKILCTFYRYYVLKEDYLDIFKTEDKWSIKEHLNAKYPKT